jgi:hypothetical protein
MYRSTYDGFLGQSQDFDQLEVLHCEHIHRRFPSSLLEALFRVDIFPVFVVNLDRIIYVIAIIILANYRLSCSHDITDSSSFIALGRPKNALVSASQTIIIQNVLLNNSSSTVIVVLSLRLRTCTPISCAYLTPAAHSGQHDSGEHVPCR